MNAGVPAEWQVTKVPQEVCAVGCVLIVVACGTGESVSSGGSHWKGSVRCQGVSLGLKEGVGKGFETVCVWVFERVESGLWKWGSVRCCECLWLCQCVLDNFVYVFRKFKECLWRYERCLYRYKRCLWNCSGVQLRQVVFRQVPLLNVFRKLEECLC